MVPSRTQLTLLPLLIPGYQLLGLGYQGFSNSTLSSWNKTQSFIISLVIHFTSYFSSLKHIYVYFFSIHPSSIWSKAILLLDFKILFIIYIYYQLNWIHDKHNFWNIFIKLNKLFTQFYLFDYSIHLVEYMIFFTKLISFKYKLILIYEKK